MIKRDKYLNQLIKNMHNGFPKVITGIRRCGKSYLLNTIFKEYLLNNGVKEENILSIDMDEISNISLRNPFKLNQYIEDYINGKDMVYIIIDEIQRVYSVVNPELTGGEIVKATKNDIEIVSFVDLILGLSHQKNIDLYVTGSNSKMLSSDIVTEFRDKATNIHMSPLSFEEFSSYSPLSKEEALKEYMLYGGMPLCILKDGEEKKDYLKSLYETTYFKDILEHNHLVKKKTLDELANILSFSIGSFLNVDKISNTFISVTHEKIDPQTVYRYISFFSDAFIISEAKRYDIKGRKEIGALRKYYFVDTGLRNARINFAYPDEGALLENVIYNELIYNGYSVNIGTFDNIGKNKEGNSIRKTNEIDFYASKGLREYYIQVCLDFSNIETRKREIRPYLLLKDQVQKIIITNTSFSICKDEHGFLIMNAQDFLLNFIK